MRVWTRQPPPGTLIDWSNPLTDGLVDVIEMYGAPRSKLLGTPAKFFGTSQKFGSGSVQGAAFDTRASFGGVYFERNDGQYTNVVQSHVGVFFPVAYTGNDAGLFGSSIGNGGSNSLILQRASGANLYMLALGSLHGFTYNGLVGAPVVVGVTGSGSSTSVYVNGLNILTVAAPPIAQTTGRLVLFGERTASAAYATEGTYALHCVFGRSLNADEHATLAINPWQLFAPLRSRRVYSLPTSVLALIGDVRSRGQISGYETLVVGVASPLRASSSVRGAAQLKASVSGNVRSSAQAQGVVQESTALLSGIRGSSTTISSLRELLSLSGGLHTAPHNTGNLLQAVSLSSPTLSEALIKGTLSFGAQVTLQGAVRGATHISAILYLHTGLSAGRGIGGVAGVSSTLSLRVGMTAPSKSVSSVKGILGSAGVVALSGVASSAGRITGRLILLSAFASTLGSKAVAAGQLRSVLSLSTSLSAKVVTSGYLQSYVVEAGVTQLAVTQNGSQLTVTQASTSLLVQQIQDVLTSLQ